MLKDQLSSQITNMIKTDFNPLIVPDTQLWLDGQDFSTFAFNGSNINQWDDKSGFSRHAVEANPLVQPLYVANGINGFPALNFALDRLITSWVPSKGNYTAFVIFRTTDGTSNPFFAQDDLGTNNVDTLFGLGKLNLFPNADGGLALETHGPGGSVNGAKTVSTYNDDVPHLAGFKVEGTSYTVFTESETASTTSSVSGCFGADGIEKLGIGTWVNNAARYNGFIGEVFIINRAVNLDEFNFLKSGFINKWNI